MLRKGLVTLLILLAFLIPTGVEGRRFVTASDDFNRADGAIGSNWTEWADATSGIVQVISNQASTPTSGQTSFFVGAYYNSGVANFSDDHFSQATITVASLSDAKMPAVCVRMSGNDVSNVVGYCAYIGTTDVYLHKFTSGVGSVSNIATFAHTMSSGDVAKLEVSGTTLKFYKNGSQVGSNQTDSSISTGQPGIAFYPYTAQPTLDNWSAEDAGGGSPPTVFPGINATRIFRTGFGQRGDASDNEAPPGNPPSGFCTDCVPLTEADFTYLGVFKVGNLDYNAYGGSAMTGRYVGGNVRLFINHGRNQDWGPLEVSPPAIGSLTQGIVAAPTATTVCDWAFDYQSVTAYETFHDKVGDTFDASGNPVEFNESFELLNGYEWDPVTSLLHATYSLLYGNYIADWNHVAISLDSCNPNGSVPTVTTAYGPWRAYSGTYHDGSKILGPSRHTHLTTLPDGTMGAGGGMMNYQNNYGNQGPSLMGGAAWPTTSTPSGFGTAVGGGQRSTDIVMPDEYLGHYSMYGFVTTGGVLTSPTQPIWSMRRPSTYVREADLGCPIEGSYGDSGLYVNPSLYGTGSHTDQDGMGSYEFINGTNKWGYIAFGTIVGRRNHDGTNSCTTGKAHVFYKTRSCMDFYRNTEEAYRNNNSASGGGNPGIGIPGSNNDLSFYAKAPFTNKRRVRYVVAGNNTPLSISVSGNDITINLATNGGGAPTSTANDVKAAIEASSPANALVTVVHGSDEEALEGGSNGTGVMVPTHSSFIDLAGGPMVCNDHQCDTGVVVTGPTANSFDAVWMIYNPDDLLEVKAGTQEPYEPNHTVVYPLADIDADIPYKTGNDPGSGSMSHGESWYDATNKHLYVIIRYADSNIKPGIAVFSVNDSASPEQIVNRAVTHPVSLSGMLGVLLWRLRRRANFS